MQPNSFTAASVGLSYHLLSSSDLLTSSEPPTALLLHSGAARDALDRYPCPSLGVNLVPPRSSKEADITALGDPSTYHSLSKRNLSRSRSGPPFLGATLEFTEGRNRFASAPEEDSQFTAEKTLQYTA